MHQPTAPQFWRLEHTLKRLAHLGGRVAGMERVYCSTCGLRFIVSPRVRVLLLDFLPMMHMLIEECFSGNIVYNWIVRGQNQAV